jgi:succinate dehydrogenase/fumarate reductase cytochrome b subunit
MPLRTLHRYSAVVIAFFVLPHLINHLGSVMGVATHITVMQALRSVYLHPLIETTLLICVAFQACSGIWLVFRGWKARQGAVAWAQALSGCYLMVFMPVHVGSVLAGRFLLHLDTNFYFAAAGFHINPFQWFFGPYYFLAVVAFGCHIACAAYWLLEYKTLAVRHAVFSITVIAGVMAATVIVLALSGQFERIDIPQRYKATYLPQRG